MPPWLFQQSHLQSCGICQAKGKYNEPNQNNIACRKATLAAFFWAWVCLAGRGMSGSFRLARPASCVGIINAHINRELALRTGLKRSLAGTMAAFVCVHWGLRAFKKAAFGFLCLHVGALQLWKLDEILVFQEFCFEVTSLVFLVRPPFAFVGGSHAAASPVS